MEAIRGTPEDDRRCDFCQREATRFWEFSIPLGGPIVHDDLCKTCADAVRRWQASG